MPPIELRLFLVRHGETASNRDFRYMGSRDEPLAPAGIEQAERIAAALAELPLAGVYASPLRRAAETGRRIAGSLRLPLREEPRLREQCFGEWEGLTRTEVLALGGPSAEQLAAGELDPACAPPGGESLQAVGDRVLRLVSDLASCHPGQWIALVSHVGPIKALLCAALGVPLTASRRMFLDPGTVSVLDWGDWPLVRLFNAQGGLRSFEFARWLR